MIRSDQILDTVGMIQKENLDVRAVTLGLDLLDCRGSSVHDTCARIQAKIRKFGSSLVPTCNALAEKYGIPVTNKRMAITPIATVCAGFDKSGFIAVAEALDDAATEIGIDFIGGFSANVEKGLTPADLALIAALPEAMLKTKRVCASINVGSTRYGINMDAIALLGKTVKELAEINLEDHHILDFVDQRR